MPDKIRLAEMLSTRLCHDLTGPIGAIANGVEFLAEGDPEMQQQAVELISQSATEAVNRLQFYRLAYGRVNAGGEASLTDTKKHVARYFAGGKVSLDWPDSYTDALDISVSRKMSRLILNMIIIANATLIRGGVVSVRIGKEDDVKIFRVYATAPHIKWDEAVEGALRHAVSLDDIDPKLVQPYMTKILADEVGATLDIQKGEEIFELIARQKGQEVGA